MGGTSVIPGKGHGHRAQIYSPDNDVKHKSKNALRPRLAHNSKKDMYRSTMQLGIRHEGQSREVWLASLRFADPKLEKEYLISVQGKRYIFLCTVVFVWVVALCISTSLSWWPVSWTYALIGMILLTIPMTFWNHTTRDVATFVTMWFHLVMLGLFSGETRHAAYIHRKLWTQGFESNQSENNSCVDIAALFQLVSCLPDCSDLELSHTESVGSLDIVVENDARTDTIVEIIVNASNSEGRAVLLVLLSFVSMVLFIAVVLRPRFIVFAPFVVCATGVTIGVNVATRYYSAISTLLPVAFGLLATFVAWSQEVQRRRLFWVLRCERVGKKKAESAARLAQKRLKAMVEDTIKQQNLVAKIMTADGSSSDVLSNAAAVDHIKLSHRDVVFKDVVGEGSYSTVYRGKLRGQAVAIKKITQSQICEDSVSTFKREIEVLAQLRHPNIVCLYGACWTDGVANLFLVLEYCSRGTLEEIIAAPSMTWERALFTVMLGTARCMTYLHHGTDRAYIHGDLKPENILICSSLQAKVADFGVTTRIAPTDLGKCVLSGSSGSPLWMPPEVLRGEKYSSKVDVFAFGMILFEVIIGDASFLRNQFVNQNDMVVKVINGHRPNIPRDVRMLLPKMVALVELCWEAESTKRPSFEYICECMEAYGLMMQQHGSITDGDGYAITRLSMTSDGPVDALTEARCKIRDLEIEIETKRIEYEETMAEKAEMFEKQLERVSQAMF